MAFKNENASLGINLGALRYFGRNRPFNNILKNGCKIISSQASPWAFGGGPATMNLDANGYPASLEPNQVITYLFASSQALNYPAGRYTLHCPDSGWNGTINANVAIGGRDSSNFGTIFSEVDGKIEVDWTPVDNNQWINVVGTGVSNLRLMLPGQADEADVFDAAFVAKNKAKYLWLRFMNWMNTNESENDGTNDTPVSYVTYGGTETELPGGVPLSVMVDLCNATDCDMRIQIPHEWSDSKISSAGAYIAANLDPELRVYPGFSNETWNGVFQRQYNYCIAQGIARGLSGSDFEKGRRFHAERSMEVATLFMSEFADESQVVPVLEGWEGDAFTTRLMMDHVHSTTGVACKDFPRMRLLIGYYFGLDLGKNPQAIDGPAVAPHTKTTITMTAAEVVAAAIIESENRWATKTSVVLADAASRGMPVDAYEGGPAITGVAGGATNPLGSTAFTDLMEEVNHHPDLRNANFVHLKRWSDGGGEGFTYFEDTLAPGSIYGNWGMFDYQDQPDAESPKWLGVEDWLASLGVTSVPNVLQTETGESLQTETGEVLGTGEITSFSLDATPLATGTNLSLVTPQPALVLAAESLATASSPATVSPQLSLSLEASPLSTSSSMAIIEQKKEGLATFSRLSEVEFASRMESQIDLPIGVPADGLMPPDRPFLQLGEAGRKLICKVLWSGAAVDLSRATFKEIVLKSPSGVVHRLRASFESNGADGLVFAVIDGTLLLSRGNWQVQVDLAIPGFSGLTSVGWLTVEYNAA